MKKEQNKIKISVIMIDGGFRKNIFGAKYFSQQDFLDDEYEIIWVDYFDKMEPEITLNPKIKGITLKKRGIYHSSYCFNKGIERARGEIIVIPDADQIVLPDFLSRVWTLHQEYEKLVVYGYRYDEVQERILKSHDFSELENKCVLKNPLNYGGCLTVRREWLLEMNGYEQHDVFRTGFHANGLLMATRFKNMGLAIQWEPSLKLYHPWHPFTLSGSLEYKSQHQVIAWVKSSMLWRAIQGINPMKNQSPSARLSDILREELNLLDSAILHQWEIDSIFDFPENTTQPLVAPVSSRSDSSLLSKVSRKLFRGTQ